MLKDAAPKPNVGTVRRARRLRRDLSLPELLLWRALRQRPGGVKFRRQHPSGAFVLDFYCADARLAIEVDGESHRVGARQRRDTARDAWFSTAGIETLRIPAGHVLADPDGTAEAIARVVAARLPLHHPAAPDGPPPRDKLGEDR